MCWHVYIVASLENMFNFIEPIEPCVSQTLPCITEKRGAILPKQLIKILKVHDIMALDYLYHNFYRQFKGAILNEEDGLNMHLQVSAFLNGMFSQAERTFLVLVLCPDELILNWHYHLSLHSGLQVQIVSPRTCPEDFDREHGLVLLLPFTCLKLADALVGYSFFSVVIDHIDEIAQKLIIRRLHGDFNIGLSRRNFFTNPDQKLQWTILNWSNPGCVGKLNEFYENDNDNFANTRDNYHHWWFTLTWKFCDNFQRLSDDDFDHYSETLSKWADNHNLLSPKKCRIKSGRYRKSGPTRNNNKEQHTQDIKSFSSTGDYISVETEKHLEKENELCISDSSSDTIIYEPTSSELEENRKISNNDIPIESDNIILSIVGDSKLLPGEKADPEIEVSYKKEELMTEIFDDDCTSGNIIQSEQADDAADFLLSLI